MGFFVFCLLHFWKSIWRIANASSASDRDTRLNITRKRGAKNSLLKWNSMQKSEISAHAHKHAARWILISYIVVCWRLKKKEPKNRFLYNFHTFIDVCVCKHSYTEKKMAKCRDPHETTGEINEDIAKIVNDREPRAQSMNCTHKGDRELKRPIHWIINIFVCLLIFII